MECIFKFNGAGRKGCAFIGWGGRVVDWPEKAAPKVEFGKWIPSTDNRWNGGKISFVCQPLDLVMVGANSKQMRSKDKTTQFGFAGYSMDGKTLRFIRLIDGMDARKIFSDGGLKPAKTPEQIADHLLVSVRQDNATTATLNEALGNAQEVTEVEYGVRPQEFAETIAAWPFFEPLNEAVTAAKELLKVKQADISAAVSAEVLKAIDALNEKNVEVTNLTIASYLTNEPVEAYKCKEKVRKLKKLLGEEFCKLS